MAGARLLLAGLLQFWGGVAVFGEPPPALRCPLLDERGSPSPRGALLRFLGGPGAPPPHPETPREPEITFDVTDPWGVLQDFWGPSREPPRCELSPTAPLLPPPPGGSPRCHPGLGARWWLLALGTARAEGTALLREGPGEPPGLNVSLFISTLTPRPRGLLGTPQTLHCSFSPPAGPFALQWLRHGRGVTRRLLAFRSDAARAAEAAPGSLLLLGGGGNPPGAGGAAGTQPPGGAMEVSLQLPPLSVSDDGSFVCSVTTPHGQVQQVLRMNVIAPPQVSLLPPRLSPGLPAELLCRAAAFFPLDVAIRWERRARGDPRPLPVTSGTAAPAGDTSGTASPAGDAAGTASPAGDAAGPSWSSGHRRGADGTFSRSAGLRVPAGTAGDSYSCLVTHVAWDVPHRVTVEVTGAPGPGAEDTAGVALVAFVIAGLCLRLWPAAGR